MVCVNFILYGISISYAILEEDFNTTSVSLMVFLTIEATAEVELMTTDS